MTTSCQPPTPARAGRTVRRVLALHPPVPGPIVRPFHYVGSPFARGLHRGVDLRAPVGTAVTAPCAGRIAWAGPGGVTIRCGRERVTLLPLTRVVVHTGARADAGDRVGQVEGRKGLHLGVRHAGDPFGYIDPAPLLVRERPPLPPLTAPRARPRRPVVARPRPVVPRAAPAPAPSATPVAPWPAWAGLALALGGVRLRQRSRRARPREQRTTTAPARAGPPERVS